MILKAIHLSRTISHLNAYVDEIKNEWSKYHSETQELLVARIDPRVFHAFSDSQIDIKLPGQINHELANTFRMEWSINGSDKSSRHAYEDFYSSLSWDKFKSKSLLEVGIGSNDHTIKSNMGLSGRPGASLFAWKNVFPAWKIIGADIDPKAVAASMADNREVHSAILDQTCSNSWKSFIEEIGVSQFSIIIDDGLHEAFANISTLFESYYLLEEYGVLVVEDVPPDQFVFWQFLFDKGVLPAEPSFWKDVNPKKAKSFDSGIVYFVKKV